METLRVCAVTHFLPARGDVAVRTSCTGHWVTRADLWAQTLPSMATQRSPIVSRPVTTPPGDAAAEFSVQWVKTGSSLTIELRGLLKEWEAIPTEPMERRKLTRQGPADSVWLAHGPGKVWRNFSDNPLNPSLQMPALSRLCGVLRLGHRICAASSVRADDSADVAGGVFLH
jgi:hypothetical protein